MIHSGDKKIKLYTGATKVKTAYLGAVKVYPNSSLAVTASLDFAAAGESLGLSIQVEDGQPWTLHGVPSGWAASATAGTGPATVTITAPNNTSTDAKGYSINIISEDLAASCSVSQLAGEIIYGAWANTAIVADTYSFGAAGGDTFAYVLAARTWTWNNVPGSGDTETTGSKLVSAAGYPSWISASANSLTCPSLGTTPRAQSDYVIECQSEIASNRVSATFTQAANYVTEMQIMTGNLKFTPGYVARTGGEAVCATAYNAMWEWKYTSGEATAAVPPSSYGTITSTSFFSASPVVTGASVNPGNGNVIWEGKTSSSMRSVTVVRNVTKTITPNTAAFPGAQTLTAAQSYRGYSYQY